MPVTAPALPRRAILPGAVLGAAATAAGGATARCSGSRRVGGLARPADSGTTLAVPSTSQASPQGATTRAGDVLLAYFSRAGKNYCYYGSRWSTPISTTSEPTAAQRLVGDIAPKLAQLTDDLLFADEWARPELARRDRSLVTVASLITAGSTEQLVSHLRLAKQSGLSETELVECAVLSR